MDFPLQESTQASRPEPIKSTSQFDMREGLNPRRLTIVMWDQAFLLRQMPGESYENYERVLDETSESWAAWYYYDSPDLDWGWLLEWASWSVEDAIEYKMWGWTPHNYCQPQFTNWQDVKWHRRLTEKFLAS